MRKLIALLTIFSFNAHAVAPTGVGGEEGSLSYTNNLKAPAYTITSLGGVNSRMETGNTNLLINPSFEHPTASTGWASPYGSITGATPSSEAINVVEGKKSLKLVLTAALTAYQDSTINASQLSGLQGVAAIKVKNTGAAGLKACVRNAGVTSSTLCVNIPADSTWKHISIPFIMTATSNGIALTSTGTSGTVYVDDAFVGTSAPFQDVSGAKLVGTITWAKTVGCSWTYTNTSFANATANASCPAPTTTGDISAPATKIPGFILNNRPAGNYHIVATGNFGVSGGNANTHGLRFSNGTINTSENQLYVGAASIATPSINGYFASTTTLANDAWQIQGYKSGTDTTFVSPVEADLQISVYYFPPATKIYSQASQDYDWTTKATTLTGFGTSPSITCKYRRRGGNLDGQCFGITGTTPSGTASLTLPDSLTIDTNRINASNTTAAAGQRVGTISQQAASLAYANAVTATGTNAANIYFANSINGTAALVPANPFNGGVSTSVDFTVPISGWSDYGVIVGSFAGLEKCANDDECTSDYVANATSTGANITLGEVNMPGWVTATYVTTGVFRFDFKAGLFTSKPVCTATTDATTYNTSSDSAGGTSYVTITTRSEAGTYGNVASQFKLHCTKTGNDYKPKTAKVASSIGVPTVPGILTTGTGNSIDTFSVRFGGGTYLTTCSASPCSLSEQIGTGISQITWSSTGTYSINFTKTYAKVSCQSQMIVSTGYYGFPANILSCSNCSSLSLIANASNNGGIYNASGILNCMGTY